MQWKVTVKQPERHEIKGQCGWSMGPGEGAASVVRRLGEVGQHYGEDFGSFKCQGSKWRVLIGEITWSYLRYKKSLWLINSGIDKLVVTFMQWNVCSKEDEQFVITHNSMKQHANLNVMLSEKSQMQRWTHGMSTWCEYSTSWPGHWLHWCVQFVKIFQAVHSRFVHLNVYMLNLKVKKRKITLAAKGSGSKGGQLGGYWSFPDEM